VWLGFVYVRVDYSISIDSMLFQMVPIVSFYKMSFACLVCVVIEKSVGLIVQLL